MSRPERLGRPRSRLPVFDVESLHEFVDGPARLLYLARLLDSFVAPDPVVLPVDSDDPWEAVDWLDAVDPCDRTVLLRRLGDMALFLAGVHADANGSGALDEDLAGRGHRREALALLLRPAGLTEGRRCA